MAASLKMPPRNKCPGCHSAIYDGAREQGWCADCLPPEIDRLQKLLSEARTSVRKEAMDAERLDFIEKHSAVIDWWKPGARWNGIDRSPVEIDIGPIFSGNTLREAVDEAIRSLQQKGEEKA